MFYKRKGVLKNFSKITKFLKISQKFRKISQKSLLRQSLFFNKISRPATLLKKRLWHRCFPVNFEKFSRIPFWQNTSGRLLLKSGLHGVYKQSWKGFLGKRDILSRYGAWKKYDCEFYEIFFLLCFACHILIFFITVGYMQTIALIWQ